VAVYGLTVAPVLTGISPGSGTPDGGTSVTLTGKNFVAGATVSFGGAAAVVTAVNAATISARTPAHKTGSVNIVVKNPDGQSATLANAFIYRKHG
jgi:hypothetical protein